MTTPKITKEIFEDIKALFYSRIGLTAYINERNGLDIKIREGCEHIDKLATKLNTIEFDDLYLMLEDGTIIRVNSVPVSKAYLAIEAIQVISIKDIVEE